MKLLLGHGLGCGSEPPIPFWIIPPSQELPNLNSVWILLNILGFYRVQSLTSCPKNVRGGTESSCPYHVVFLATNPSWEFVGGPILSELINVNSGVLQRRSWATKRLICYIGNSRNFQQLCASNKGQRLNWRNVFLSALQFPSYFITQVSRNAWCPKE